MRKDPRKEKPKGTLVSGRVPRKDFVEGFRGRIHNHKLFFCWPISAEGFLRKDPRKDFPEGTAGRVGNTLRDQTLPGRIPEGFRKDPEGSGHDPGAMINSMTRRHCLIRKDFAEGSAEGFCGRIPEGSAEGSPRKEKKLAYEIKYSR